MCTKCFGTGFDFFDARYEPFCVSDWFCVCAWFMLLAGGISLPASGQDREVEPAGARQPTSVYNTQTEDVPRPTATEAARGMIVPEGFEVSVFAAEPDVQQPIAIATDERGRLWVAENYTYAERQRNFDTQLSDRIVILDDQDGDGRAERRKVFWDQGVKLTSVELGFGGVWALCPPQLLFIPDRDRDDEPDSEPIVVLDGWDAEDIRHNIANGLRWGPDGWLYGRHGIQATSLVGAPGTQPEYRTKMDCGIWRYHPTRRTFEVVCRGTTNPWGMDWDEHGQMFFINTVIGHLWHVIPGAYYQRMYGEHVDADLYELIGQTADHYHWDTKENWSDIRKLGVTATTDQAGGGHAHSGLMIYLGDNWPARFRNHLFTANFHGRRLNEDRIERAGATYVGRHEPDFLKVADPWFRGIDLLYGPDGSVYLADWSDIGECHENDGIHRTSGRIFKIRYRNSGGAGQGSRSSAPVDLRQLDHQQLIQLQQHANAWFARQARRLLQEQAAQQVDFSSVHQQLRAAYHTAPSTPIKLRLLWCLATTGGTSADWLREQLADENEQIRGWVVQLLVDDVTAPPAPTRQALEKLARRERSGLVLTYLASALRRFPLEQRWELAAALAAHGELADDRVFPLMVWYGIVPALETDPGRGGELVAQTPISKLRRYVAQRVTTELEHRPEGVDGLVQLLGKETTTAATKEDILIGMTTALRGWRRAPAPATWPAIAARLATSQEETQTRLVRELSVVFGDGRALDELRQLAGAGNVSLDERRAALHALISARAENLDGLLQSLLQNRDLAADAVRGLAVYNQPDTPQRLISAYPGFRQAAREATLSVLTSRVTSAQALLTAIHDGKIGRDQVSAFQIRQLQAFADPKLNEQIAELWPELKQLASDKLAKIVQYRNQLTESELKQANLLAGRELFERNCAKCHKLFGEGGAIGPELTGAQRNNLNYLLENVVDPSATVSKNYHLSTVVTTDGRVLNGIVQSANDRVIRLQTPNDLLVIGRDEIEELVPSQLSLMPEGMLDVLAAGQVRDLIGYLMSPQPIAAP
jgi:putative membrane-bound dehydrogenase-like protein